MIGRNTYQLVDCLKEGRANHRVIGRFHRGVQSSSTVGRVGSVGCRELTIVVVGIEGSGGALGSMWKIRAVGDIWSIVVVGIAGGVGVGAKRIGVVIVIAVHQVGIGCSICISSWVGFRRCKAKRSNRKNSGLNNIILLDLCSGEQLF